MKREKGENRGMERWTEKDRERRRDVERERYTTSPEGEAPDCLIPPTTQHHTQSNMEERGRGGERWGDRERGEKRDARER